MYYCQVYVFCHVYVTVVYMLLLNECYCHVYNTVNCVNYMFLSGAWYYIVYVAVMRMLLSNE